MAQAKTRDSTPPTNTSKSSEAGQVAEGLFEFETPLLRIRSLAYAARMLADSVEMGDAPGLALDALADTILNELEAVIEERGRLFTLAFQASKGGSHAED